MKVIHSDRDMKSYGSPRMHQELVSRGLKCSENTVAKHMKDNGIRAATAKKFRVTTDSNHAHPVAENVLDREFEQASAARRAVRRRSAARGSRPRIVCGWPIRN